MTTIKQLTVKGANISLCEATNKVCVELMFVISHLDNGATIEFAKLIKINANNGRSIGEEAEL